jgi:hypothetical protein
MAVWAKNPITGYGILFFGIPPESRSDYEIEVIKDEVNLKNPKERPHRPKQTDRGYATKLAWVLPSLRLERRGRHRR